MTIIANGEVKGAFPAATGAYLGLVNKIIIAQNLSATGIVSVKQGTNILRQFNTPSATGASDPTFIIDSNVEGANIDPTQFWITVDGASHGAFVTYFVS